MSDHINQSDLMELTIEEQQITSGGNCNFYSCYKPPVCCGCNHYGGSMPYRDFASSGWY